MMAAGSRATFALLILINGLLLSILLYEVIGLRFVSGVTAAVTAPALPGVPDTKNKPVVTRSIDDYKAMVNRPLFNQERRPIDITQDQGGEDDAKAFKLVGVVLTPEQQVAIIYSNKQEKPVKVALWGWIEGWRLIAVDAEKVVLRKGNRSLELALQRASKTEAKTKTNVKK